MTNSFYCIELKIVSFMKHVLMLIGIASVPLDVLGVRDRSMDWPVSRGLTVQTRGGVLEGWRKLSHHMGMKSEVSLFVVLV